MELTLIFGALLYACYTLKEIRDAIRGVILRLEILNGTALRLEERPED